MIPMNPCKGIAIEKSEKVTVDPILEDESKILQPEEIKTFLDAAKNTRYYELFYIILNTGMRIGEITALCWSDIDFEKKVAHIQRSMEYRHSVHEPQYSKNMNYIDCVTDACQLLEKSIY